MAPGKLSKNDILFSFRGPRGKKLYVIKSKYPTLDGFNLSTTIQGQLNPRSTQDLEQFNRLYNFAAYGGSRTNIVGQNLGPGSTECVDGVSCKYCCMCEGYWPYECFCGDQCGPGVCAPVC